MSAEYSVDEVRALSDGIRRIAGGALSDYDGVDADERALNKAADMLLKLAERIKADKSAVTENVVQCAERAFWPVYLECLRTRGLDKHATGMRAALLAVWPNTPAQAAQVDGRMSDELRNFIEGMSVSVDVSTGDADAGHRYFGTVTEVMDCADDRHGVTLLVQDAEPNFKAEKPVSSVAIEALRDVDHVVTQWRKSGREPAYGQWLNLQDLVRAALAAEPVAQGEAVDVKQTAEYSYGYQQALQDTAARPRAVPDADSIAAHERGLWKRAAANSGLYNGVWLELVQEVAKLRAAAPSPGESK